MCIYIYILKSSRFWDQVFVPHFRHQKPINPFLGAIYHRAQAIPVFVRSQRWIVQCHPEWILR